MDQYVTVNGKKYRKGYTTGSCAAAAAKAAVEMLFTGRAVDMVEIDTPAGVRLKLSVEDVKIEQGYAESAIVKDGGDDPDITTGLKIFARVEKSSVPGIEITTGEGIGRVTLPGLKVKPGQPAINPVPMAMIWKEVGEVLPAGMGVTIRLSVPGGEEVAKKTYNPKLGIQGGISILGTKGIVEPMSEEAWKDSLELELKILAAKNIKDTYFIFGNYGEDFLEKCFPENAENVVKISNFVGFMLDKAVENGFEKVVLAGHIGKLVKVAAGIFHTHSRMADARLEILTAYAALEGAPKDVLQRIYECKTTEAAVQIIDEQGLTAVYTRIVENVVKRCESYTFNKLNIGAILFDSNDRILAKV